MAAMTSVMNTTAGLKLGSLHTFHPTHSSRLSQRNFQIRCMAEGDPKKTSEANDVQIPNPSSTKSSPSTPKKVSTNFVDVFAFSGAAPEIINGRLAMVGFVSAIGVELATGRDLLSQIGNGGVTWFVASSLVFTIASLVPLLNGISAESKSQSVMSSNAELWNGRFAMLGLLALAFTEYVKGGPLV